MFRYRTQPLLYLISCTTRNAVKRCKAANANRVSFNQYKLYASFTRAVKVTVFVLFKNRFNAILRYRLPITLRNSKVPLTKTVAFPVHVNEVLLYLQIITWRHRKRVITHFRHSAPFWVERRQTAPGASASYSAPWRRGLSCGHRTSDPTVYLRHGRCRSCGVG